MLGKALTTAAAGNAGAAGVLGIEDVFSTSLYTGNGSTQTITNGIDLAGEGGLVWIKHRNYANSHQLYDTLRGAGAPLYSNITNREGSNPSFTAFTSSGFSLSSAASLDPINGDSSQTYASWAFRKAPGFFDVVTYTGNGSNRTIAHSLGSVPGTIIVKRTDTSADWQVYHRSLANTEYLVLNSTAAKATGTTRWNSTTPTSSVFSLGTDTTVNASGGTYVAYLFAHDEAIFGENEDQSIIKCGSYTGNGSTSGPTIDLGWEPQWVMIKRATGGIGNWSMFDTMRGITVGGADAIIYANTSDAEATATALSITPQGFQINVSATYINNSGDTYIYIAIRRGPMKTPTSATEVFNVSTASSGNTAAGFVVDNFWRYIRYGAGGNTEFRDRLRGGNLILSTAATSAEGSSNNFLFDNMEGVTGNLGGSNLTVYFRRAPGFFDVVAYTGTGVARTVDHNLGVVPELMIVKSRSSGPSAPDWFVYCSALPTPETKILYLNSNVARTSGVTVTWNSTNPTSSVFSLGTYDGVNGNTYEYIAYLFATLPGISKVGSYTGTGTTLDIDCGFTSGARFVLIKRTDSAGDWYVWDTARGIVSGNDPYLLLNSTAAEVTSTDYIDPLSSGFQISSTAPAAINASGGSFIFLAIA